MKLEDLGYNNKIEESRIEKKLNIDEIGRVIAEHKERYTVRTAKSEFEAEITGNMRFSATSREDFPAVGDWVALTNYDSDFAIIYKILPRFSSIKRQAVGKTGEVQVIAANIDYAFLVQSVDRDFNINRLERYLSICYSAKIEPIIVLSKTDLVDKERRHTIIDSIKLRVNNVPVIAVSNKTENGYSAIREIIKEGKTYCLLGSSGSGKSTLINNLSGKYLMKTGEISQSTNKGRHITSHRELTILETGGILIDNPGMKEVGITDSTGGLETTFDIILRFSENCKFKNCTHTNEIDCSVIEAVENGVIDKASYNNYLKMEKEKAHFDSTIAEKRKKDKELGKTIKNYKKHIHKKKD